MQVLGSLSLVLLLLVRVQGDLISIKRGNETSACITSNFESAVAFVKTPDAINDFTKVEYLDSKGKPLLMSQYDCDLVQDTCNKWEKKSDDGNIWSSSLHTGSFITDYRWNDLPLLSSDRKIKFTKDSSPFHFSILSKRKVKIEVSDGRETNETTIHFCGQKDSPLIQISDVNEILVNVTDKMKKVLHDCGTWTHVSIITNRTNNALRIVENENRLLLAFRGFKNQCGNLNCSISFGDYKELLVKIHKFNELKPNSKNSTITLEVNQTTVGFCVDVVFFCDKVVHTFTQDAEISNKWVTRRFENETLKLNATWKLKLKAETANIRIGGIRFCAGGDYNTVKPNGNNMESCHLLAVNDPKSTTQEKLTKVAGDVILCQALGGNCAGLKACGENGTCVPFTARGELISIKKGNETVACVTSNFESAVAFVKEPENETEFTKVKYVYGKEQYFPLSQYDCNFSFEKNCSQWNLMMNKWTHTKPELGSLITDYRWNDIKTYFVQKSGLKSPLEYPIGRNEGSFHFSLLAEEIAEIWISNNDSFSTGNRMVFSRNATSILYRKNNNGTWKKSVKEKSILHDGGKKWVHISIVVGANRSSFKRQEKDRHILVVDRSACAEKSCFINLKSNREAMFKAHEHRYLYSYEEAVMELEADKNSDGFCVDVVFSCMKSKQATFKLTIMQGEKVVQNFTQKLDPDIENKWVTRRFENQRLILESKWKLRLAAKDFNIGAIKFCATAGDMIVQPIGKNMKSCHLLMESDYYKKLALRKRVTGILNDWFYQTLKSTYQACGESGDCISLNAEITEDSQLISQKIQGDLISIKRGNETAACITSNFESAVAFVKTPDAINDFTKVEYLDSKGKPLLMSQYDCDLVQDTCNKWEKKSDDGNIWSSSLNTGSFITDYRWNDLPLLSSDRKIKFTKDSSPFHFSILSKRKVKIEVSDGRETNETTIHFCGQKDSPLIQISDVNENLVKVTDKMKKVLHDCGTWTHVAIITDRPKSALRIVENENRLLLAFRGFKNQCGNFNCSISFGNDKELLVKIHKFKELKPNSKNSTITLEVNQTTVGFCVDVVFFCEMSVTGTIFDLKITQGDKVVQTFTQNAEIRNKWVTRRFENENLKLNATWKLKLKAETRNIRIGGIRFCAGGDYNTVKPNGNNMESCHLLAVNDPKSTTQEKLTKVAGDVILCQALGGNCAGLRACGENGTCVPFTANSSTLAATTEHHYNSNNKTTAGETSKITARTENPSLQEPTIPNINQSLKQASETEILTSEIPAYSNKFSATSTERLHRIFFLLLIVRRGRSEGRRNVS
ncbi:Hypothetical predicted protein [Cloeon dipterum]|uniref:Uncharacterized protein n=1 Tax=Cloeon dipterum TaxID=197152 RepID=A0A8S1DM10_9INSE|nr:Hypothetical predicted protein [Cloeon dipterum]